MKELVKVAGRSVLTMTFVLSGLMMMTGNNLAANGHPKAPGVWLSQEEGRRLTSEREAQLVESLQRITGLTDLRFEADGSLSVGEESRTIEGAFRARQILHWVIESGFVFIIEDHSSSPEVNFGQMDQGTNYEDSISQCQLLIWCVRIDFDDFDRMGASQEVRASFDSGFTLLHELLHGLGYRDAQSYGALGECEEQINLVRRELGLVLRDQYFGDQVQIVSNFMTVRLRFSSKLRRRKHYLFFVTSPETRAYSFSDTVMVSRKGRR
ncbi:MAG: hypothetical protein AB7P14_15880 [Blastocatellales bacterium]